MDDEFDPTADLDADISGLDVDGDSEDVIEENPFDSEEADEVDAEDGADEQGDEDDANPQRFTIKVDGQEREVPLDELLSGYQRQADYTRKTQELAAERQRLAQMASLEQAFNEDPVGTIQKLAAGLGLNVDGLEVEAMDPAEARIRDLEQKLHVQEQERAAAQIERQISDLQAKYGDFDPQDLVDHAIARGIGNLEVALRDFLFDQRKAEAEQRQQQRRQAKRQASVVEGGKSRSAATTVAANTQNAKPTLREAWEQAKAQLQR